MSALPPKADIGTQSWNVRFVPSKLMSGAAGAIAALALGPRYRRQAALKNKFLPPGQIRKAAYDATRHPRANFENAKK